SNLKIDFHSVDEFYILLDDPHKPWLPGEEVSGQIILISNKNLANIVITLSLIGHVKINASSHSKLRPIKYCLFNHTIKIYGDSPLAASENDFANGLFKGEHRFPFIVKLPNKRIFTSIDFGKGSIAYLLRASIGNLSSYASPVPAASPNHGLAAAISNSPSTHSSPIDSNSPSSTTSHMFSKNRSLKVLNNPIYTAEKIINLISPINVATLPPPKPKRLIIKDPRNSRRLSRTQSSTSTINTINTVNSYSTYSSNNSEEAGITAQPSMPNGVKRVNSAGTVATTNASAQVPLPAQEALKSDNIKVSLEIAQRGFIRGELIPIKISINHLKKVQDVNGIIVTFVRVCRLDKPDGTFESFRKDLQQLIIPLYVDPVTFKSEINSSVRVPADAFPTIVGCPLVSFQYFIEVLINLSGKSLTLDDENMHPPHHRSSFDDVENHSGSQSDILGSGTDSYKFNFNFNSTVSTLQHQKERSGFVNTDKFKRLKKFLQLTTEIIIGTHRGSPATVSQTSSSPRPGPPVSAQSPDQNYSAGSAITGVAPAPSPSYIGAIPESIEMNNFHTPPYFESHQNHTSTANSSSIPNYDELAYISSSGGAVIDPPATAPGSLSEKERMKLHESSLLPSVPPEFDDGEDNGSVLSPTVSVGEGTPNEAVEASHQFQFFTFQSPLNTISEADHPQPNDSDDDLYRDPTTTASDDQYSAIDFVPKYETVNNDKLIAEGANVGTGTHES
ncbi:uncharacterized protein CANTADRAFT_30570, partial [Suhomyces tanzawaensis NRRL Y-17324]